MDIGLRTPNDPPYFTAWGVATRFSGVRAVITVPDRHPAPHKRGPIPSDSPALAGAPGQTITERNP